MILLQCVNTGEKIELRQEIAKSGEGRIYQTSKNGFLAKIYHSSGQEKINKLRIMVDNPPDDPTLAQGHISIAWPKDLLKDTDGKCLGFLMPAIQGSQTLINVYIPRKRRETASGFNWRDLHLTALHLAFLIQSLHASNYVVGDLKPENLLVNERGLVSIIDTDSFQVIDPRTGKIYLSPVASSEYTSPEMFGEVLPNVGRSEVQDRFGLAIIIWLLLFGYHPFSGEWVGDGNQPNIDKLIRCGYWMYGSNPKIRPGKVSMPLNILHPELQQCFLQCFNDGHNNPYTRPSAADWVKSLDIALKDLEHCSIEVGHYYARSYGKCYWCERKQQLGGFDIFESPDLVTHIPANPPINRGDPMPIPPNTPLRRGASEDKKRKRIRNYFKRKCSWGLFIVALLTFIVALLPLPMPIGVRVLIILIVWLWWLFFLINVPGDRTIDAWLIDDIEQLKKHAVERLNLVGEKLKEPLGTDGHIVIIGAILWNTFGVPDKDIRWKKGRDKLIRFSIYSITIICLTEHKLSSFQCDFNFMRGVPLNESDEEFYYQDIVAVSKRNDSTNYTLPNGKVMKHSQIFKLSVSSGDSITAVVSSPEILKYTGGSLPDTGRDDAVKVLREVLRKKKRCC